MSQIGNLCPPDAAGKRTGFFARGQLLRDAAAIVCLGIVSGCLSNLLRSEERLAWVQTKPYDIVVPCPEPVGTAQSIAPNAAPLRDFRTLVVDARSESEFAAWHVPGAINVPFDWLGPPVQEDVGRLAKRIAATQVRQLVIYGDGDNPDSGREWARLLSGGGIRNVSYVEGGAPALKRAETQSSPATSPPATSPPAAPTSSKVP